MSKLFLKRTETSDQGTFGILTDEADRPVALTCERPDNGNKAMGCIPNGIYNVVRFNSPSKGSDFLVHDVPGRSMIEIHKGNTIVDTEGCILVGLTRGDIDGVPAILSSASALSRLLATYPQGFELEITQEYAS